MLFVQRRYLLTYSYDIALLYSLGSIHPLPTCQTLIELITLVAESFFINGHIISTARWLPFTGIYRFELAVGTSSQSAHSCWTEPKEAKKYVSTT